MEGIVFNIQRYSTNDGPGIRTTVFLKGCRLNCFWCHNPEGIEPEPEIQINYFKCIGCGKCIGVCSSGARKIIDEKLVYLRAQCKCCGKCVAICYAGATEWVGAIMTVEKVIEEIERDYVFYNKSGGGVTFSGGEPAHQTAFLKELLKSSKQKKIHTAVDTSGHASWNSFNEILPYTDLFLYDLKLIDEHRHKTATGVSNKLILSNLIKLSKERARIIVRVPIIPKVNNSIGEMAATANFIKEMDCIESVELVPFHQLGSGKYEKLGKEYIAKDFSLLDQAEIKKIKNVFTKMGFRPRECVVRYSR